MIRMPFALSTRLALRLAACCCALPVCVLTQDAPETPTDTGAWSQWRGPLGTGAAPTANPPVTWSETENVRFKTPLPGYGHGSPIVHGNRIFLTAAIPFGPELEPVPDDAPGAHDNATVTQRHRFVVLAIDRTTGEVAWQHTVHEQVPHDVYHKSSTLVAASAVADDEHVFAFFGSYGLYALDHAGKVTWQHDLGDMQIKHGHGEGSTPALHGNTLVVNWDHEGESFVVAFDKRTGEERWRRDRGEVTSWSTPIIVEHDGRRQVIVSATGALRAYDLVTGEVVWSCRGLSHNVVASPVAANGMVFAGSSYEKRRMFGVALAGAKGDVTNTKNVVWRRQRSTPYVPSPLLYGDWLYFLNHYQGFLVRVHAPTGREPARPLRLPGMREIYASPVGAGDRIYVTSRSGATLVLSHKPEAPRVLAHNVLDDSFSASAAIVGDELFLRGERHLYCIARPAAK
ncbi:MAG: PQQ-binding-like beta-propeller repeat protein [bacterium]|nr:PQQ-binding-like beta-propeller repeat protein [bacterium]